MDYDVFVLPELTLQSGITLHDVRLAHKTFGTLNADKSNVVVYPTWYSGQHYDNEWLIGDNMALDPRKYFIIIPDMLANGLSSSPSNTPQPFDKARFPNVTVYDNVQAQHRLVTEKYGIEKMADNPKYHADFLKALGAIKAEAVVMPGKTDLYFTPGDGEYEAKHMPNAVFRPIPSIRRAAD